MEVAESDLTLRHGVRANGTRLKVRIFVLDKNSRPVVGASVELWNVNAKARYIGELGASDDDPGFVGFGRALTDFEGGVSFQTVWPVSYVRYGVLRRPPHLHGRVRAFDRDEAYEIEIPPPPNEEDSDVMSIWLAP